MEKDQPYPTDSQRNSGLGANLVIFNDDVNTFDFVIATLIEVCNHKPEQAEQCTLIIHYKGKCVVRTAETEVLEPMCDEILKRGLTARIE